MVLGAESFVVVLAGEALVAVPSGQVLEVADDGPTSPLPRAPRHLLGLLNHRGAALPVLDLAVVLGTSTPGRPLGPDGAALPRRILVAKSRDYTVGLRCERVLGLRPLDEMRAEARLSVGERLHRYTSAEADTELGVVSLVELSLLLEEARA